jgi:hypothetical protein
MLQVWLRDITKETRSAGGKICWRQEPVWGRENTVKIGKTVIKGIDDWIGLIEGIGKDLIGIMEFCTIVGRELGFIEPKE